MDNQDNIPLDRDEIIEDEERKSDAQSEKGQDEEMSDAESKTEENPE